MAGAMARAASQGTIHPLDTLKVQMQVGRRGGQAGELGNFEHVLICSRCYAINIVRHAGVGVQMTISESMSSSTDIFDVNFLILDCMAGILLKTTLP